MRMYEVQLYDEQSKHAMWYFGTILGSNFKYLAFVFEISRTLKSSQNISIQKRRIGVKIKPFVLRILLSHVSCFLGRHKPTWSSDLLILLVEMSRLNYINLVPQEILTNIFTRLPAKSLGLCKCVSKSWDSFISDPYFIKTHVTKTSVNNIILIYSYSKLMYSVCFDKYNLCDKNASKLRFSCCDSWSKVWGSCDGLVLVEDAWRTMYLLNPTTLESKKEPALSCRFWSHTIRNLYGFGYDSSSDDYAVVFMCYQPGFKKEFCVYVYILKKNLWEKIGYSRMIIKLIP